MRKTIEINSKNKKHCTSSSQKALRDTTTVFFLTFTGTLSNYYLKPGQGTQVGAILYANVGGSAGCTACPVGVLGSPRHWGRHRSTWWFSVCCYGGRTLVICASSDSVPACFPATAGAACHWWLCRSFGRRDGPGQNKAMAWG